MEQLKKIWKMFVNRETITYGIAGVCTTLVNWLAYFVLRNILWSENLDASVSVSGVLAGIISIAFAYVINARWVFQEKRENFAGELKKIIKFFGARAVTLVVEAGGRYLLVCVLFSEEYEQLIVVFVSVIVIILNYIFSKLFVFTKHK